MSQTNLVQPKITFLTEELINQVHEDSLRILAQAGVHVESDRALKLLAERAGVKVSETGRVKFEREVVEWAIQAVPSHFDVYNRLGERVFRMGDDSARFGIGTTALHYQDPVSGKTVPFNRKHMTSMVRLGQALPEYDAVSTIGILQDLPPQVADMYAILEMTANTTKPLIVLVSKDSLFTPVLDMLESLNGDLAPKPYILPYLNPITPMVINQGTVDKMFASVERGLPFIYNSYGLAGMTNPITPAGTLTQLNAELLAGLTVTQIIKEGAPISLGMLPAYIDMQSMVNFYDPTSYLINIACIEIMAHYKIPHSGASGGGQGWGADFMSSSGYWLAHFSSLMSRAALLPFVGNTMSGKAFSPINVVFAHEIIQQARKFTQGFPFDKESIGLSEIIERGQGGHFLSSPLTREHVRTAYHTSDVYPRITFEKWQKLGEPDAMLMLKEYTRDLLSDLAAPEDNAELLGKGEAFIEEMVRKLNSR
ncbi:MAG: hypothetical protein FVQ83_11375 [Chloroflexi bacterium]|nr:hypothetical protein [Chloroflexota bacterium]